MKLSDPSLLKTDAFINGQFVSAPQDKRFAVQNPSSGETVAEVADFGADGITAAIEAAEAARKGWAATTAKERAAILRRWNDLCLEHADDLAIILTAEMGKPLAEARGEVAYAASFAEWFAEEAKRTYGHTIPAHKTDARIVVTQQPVGVVGAITPWNFPLAMITRKAAPALAAGCSVVIKPSELTPFSALAMMVLAEEAGVPPGLMSVVTGLPEAIGGELTGNPTVRKITFTGSTRVGKLLMAQSSDHVKRVSLELGGNAPFIVFDDADLDAAVAGAMASKFRNAGQTCVCANRFYVHDAVYDAFMEKFAAAIRELNVGNGLEEGVSQGPLINAAAIDKVKAHVADAVARGGRIVLGGKPHALGGTFFEPTLIADVTTDAQLCCEETFGPVAGVMRFTDEAEVVALANDSRVGLAGYFYSKDLSRVWRVAEALEVGIVGVNEGIISTEAAPFGGIKESGLGREGSSLGIEEYLESKYILMGGV